MRLLMSKQFHSIATLCCQDNWIIIFCVYVNLIRPLLSSSATNGFARLIQIKNFHMSGTGFDFVQNGLESLYFNG